MKPLLVALLAIVSGLALLVAVGGRPADADNPGPPPGTMPSALVSCPNVNGSTEPPLPSEDPDFYGGVRAADISLVVQAFFHDAPSGDDEPLMPPYGFPNEIDSDYVFLYDRTGPTGGPDGRIRAGDISNVVKAFFTQCPRVDTQIAQATQWVIQDHPELLVENATDLEAAGYLVGTIDVPGQGEHYLKGSGNDTTHVFTADWDGTFDLAAPEGLVYKNGLLAAQLYVTNGTNVGWVESPTTGLGPCWDGLDNDGQQGADMTDPDCQQTAGSGDPLDDINIDPLCNPSTTLSCSWDGPEGWHLHYELCTIHVGSPNVFTFPQPSQSACQSAHNAGGASDGYWAWAAKIGWMGHLWNWIPNSNRVPDAEYAANAKEDPLSGTPGSCTDGQDNGGDGTTDTNDDDCRNGRFADCFPDPASGGPWKAYNCPQ